MFSAICKRIAYFCVKKDLIRAVDTDWFIYATQKRLFSISVLTLFFLFCIVAHRFIIGVAFLGGFKLLRNCMNGYHASSPLRCALLSLAIFIFGIYSLCPIAIRFPRISSILCKCPRKSEPGAHEKVSHKRPRKSEPERSRIVDPVC